MSNILNAFKSMIRNLSMTFASLLLVTLTLMVVGFISILSLNTNQIATDVINSITISAFVEPDLTLEQSEGLKSQIEAINGVNEAVYSSKEQELADITKTFGEDGDTIYEFYEPINPLSDVYIVSVDENITDFSSINSQISEIDGIMKSTFGEESTTDNFVQTMQLIQQASYLVSAILAFVSLFIISNTIKLNITARFKEIEIMRLVGATKTYIRLPFVIEGLFIGLLGGFIAAGLLHFGYIKALNTNFLSILSTNLLTSTEIAKFLYEFIPVGGMLIGGIGSLLAIHKYLSK